MNLDARLARTLRHFLRGRFYLFLVQFLFPQVREQRYTATEHRGYKEL